MFTESFGRFVCAGDTITCEVDGFTVTATLYNDDDATPPWCREDGHGLVTDWLPQERKQAGWRVLTSNHGDYRYYDFAAAVRQAKADGWGVAGGKLPGESAAQYAARAAESDYETLKAWCNDEWAYFGVAVTVTRAGAPLTGKYDHALWGVEGNYPGGDNSYLAECANQYINEAVQAARAKLAVLCECAS